MVQIVWLKSAKDDLKSIYDFISLDSKRYAKLQVQKIYTCTFLLKTNPLIGKKVSEMNEPSIKEIIVGNYRIIYRIISMQTIHILMIHHGARNLTKRLK
jgi:toxin ParE1/3/4